MAPRTTNNNGMLASPRSRALLAAVITVLLITALVVYILYGEKKPKDKSPTVINNQSVITSDFEGSGEAPLIELTDPSFTIPLINDEETIVSTLSESTASTQPATTTAFVPVDDETKATLPECSIIQREDRPKCEVENQPPRSAYEKFTQFDTRNGSISLIEEVQPVHYDVNISISNVDARLLKASAEVFVRIPTTTSAIPLHVDRTVINLNASTIFVRNCQTGEFVCVKSIAQLIEKQIIVLVLSSPVEASSMISIYFEHFDVQIYSNMGLVLQSPSKWEKQRAWILGSVFDTVGARTVFPSIDQPNVKASWRLCTQHPSNMTARSNMPSETVLEQESSTIRNCFQKSPALRPDHFSFVIFDNLLAIHSDTKEPTIEVFVAKHLQHTDNKWIVLEVQDALKKMVDLTGVDYPLPKLSIVSMPLHAVDAMHPLGLINIRENWIEYPKYLLTHTILNRQIVYQWVSNLFTICDKCIQDGLSMYLEWLVSADFESVNIPAKERAMDTKKKLLSYGNDRSPLRALLIEPSKYDEDCVSRSALIFSMLDDTFGVEAMKRFVQALASSKSWSTCASKQEISSMLLDATLSPVSQQIFDSFAADSKDYPILRLKLTDIALTVSSESSNRQNPHPFTVAYSVLNEEGRPLNLVSNGSEISHDAPGKTIVVDPIGGGFFRAIYDIDNYKRLAECTASGQCSKLPPDSLKSVLDDLCWALMSNQVKPVNTQKTEWHELFAKFTEKNLVSGDCQCCMQSKKTANAQCKWIWKDKCSKLDLAEQ